MSTSIIIGLICMASFILLMFVGVPIPLAMLIPAVISLSIIMTPEAAIQVMSSDILSYFSNYTLTVGPMFGLMGFFASYSGLGGNMFDALNAFLGHKRGGLAHATVVACAGFGAICGSVPATITTMSSVAYPEMRKRGYSPSLAGSTIASAPLISVLIPPSTTFIIYGMASSTSIGKLFVGGIFPGLVITLFDMIAVMYIVKRHPEWGPASSRSSWKQRWQSLFKGGLFEIIIIFLISMGGMFTGVFTATEAGAVGAFGMLTIIAIRRKINFRKFWTAVGDGARLAAMIFLLLGCANVFGRMFTVSTIPTALGTFVKGLEVPGWAVVGVILIIYFIIGMFADLLSMMLVTLPIFFPIVVTQLGYSPVWFGIILTILIGVGGITPPVGSGVFLTRGCISWDKEATIGALFKGVWPFVATTMAATILMVIFPSIVTFLPDVVFG